MFVVFMFSFSKFSKYTISFQAIGQQSSVVNARQEAFNIRKAGMHSQSQTASQLQSVNPRAGLESMFKKEGDDNSSKFKTDIQGICFLLINKQNPVFLLTLFLFLI